MLKTMKLSLAAAFLLAGLSLAGCKNCKEESSMSSPNAMTPVISDLSSYYVYFVDKKTGRPLIGDGEGQIPLGAVKIKSQTVKVQPMTDIPDQTLFGPFKWFFTEGHVKHGISFTEGSSSDVVIYHMTIHGEPRTEIIDECNSITWVDYGHYYFEKPGVTKAGVLQQTFRGDGMTDTLRIEVER